MQLISRAMPSDCDIYLASDLHVGSLGTHYDGIMELVSEIASKKNRYLIILGDLCEAICVDDKRFDPNTADLSLTTPMQQYLKVIELLRPVADRILYINDGNHDYKHARTINFVRDMVCRELQVPYGTYATKFTVRDSKSNAHCKLYTTHGFGSISSSADDPIRRKANMRLSLKRKLKNKAADCVLMAMAHTHTPLVSPPEHSLYLYDDGERIKQDYLKSAHGITPFIHPEHRWLVNTGSFLKNQVLGASGYAERSGYDPVELGYAICELRGHQVEYVREVLI